MGAFDLYDVLAEVGYGAAPHTRADRAEAFGSKQRPLGEPAEMLRQTKERMFAG